MTRQSKKELAGLLNFLLETLPGESKEILLAYNDMLQESPDKAERQKNEIRIYCYIMTLAESGIISEAEADILTASYIPKW